MLITSRAKRNCATSHESQLTWMSRWGAPASSRCPETQRCCSLAEMYPIARCLGSWWKFQVESFQVESFHLQWKFPLRTGMLRPTWSTVTQGLRLFPKEHLNISAIRIWSLMDRLQLRFLRVYTCCLHAPDLASYMGCTHLPVILLALPIPSYMSKPIAGTGMFWPEKIRHFNRMPSTSHPRFQCLTTPCGRWAP